ncbi:Uncharacterised protein [Legionella pneumophila]|uniref:hypothetical protein n=1 Tax=Legionella pneumophila TaxID=446 RepID=UPI00077088BC|nr:hypothetical protein [Legionella pneumophila]CZH56948.1 Uncharacterised protein [Legionella pneumophila]
MPKFKTDEERMKHPQAKLIPSSMWNDNELFCETLNDTVLSLMKVTEKDLMYRLTNAIPKLNNLWLKKQAWLAIALSHPNLELSMLEQVAKLLGLEDSKIFSLLAILGKVHLLAEFVKRHAQSHILELIASNSFSVYRKAAENGHIDVLDYLETLVKPKQVIQMIRAVDFSAYRDAARNGHLDVLKNLEGKAPDLVLSMIKAENFYAYRLAAARGNIEILKHLEANVPNLITDMVKAEDFYAFRKAFENGHIEQCKSLLSKSNLCFAYAEMHMREYGEQIIEPFIDQLLLTLHRDSLNTPAHGVFDVKDPEQAKICFYMIRNIIRRNDRDFDDQIRFLLSIPSVRDLAHREITVGLPNELVRLALTTGNQQAASILLNIPEVRILSEQNNYYYADIPGQLDLARLAKDRESAMTALTKGEQKRLNAAIEYYRPALKEHGVDKLMNDLREQLRQRYESKPALIVSDDGLEIKLPMDFSEFQKLNLNKNEYQQALKAYYQHKDHTAWRYLAKPNLWMNNEASYVYFDKKRGERWSTFEEYQPLIVLFWLAATDNSTPPIDGHTFQSRLDHFIDELALIGRAHNWDQTRINEKQQEEEYDDLTGDKPSCFSGVKRRLFQSVLGHPLITILTEDMILEEIRNFARDHFQSQINEENRHMFKEAFEDYIVNTNDIEEDNKKLLLTLNISKEKLQQFEFNLVNKYGAQYAEDYFFQKLVRTKLSLASDGTEFFYQSHALSLDGIVGFYKLVNGSTLIRPDFR